MKKQKIYVDTSVVGGCFDEEFSLWSNGLMKDFLVGNFLPIVSEIVTSEIAPAPKRVREKYVELIDMGAEILTVSDEAMQLLRMYQKRTVLSDNFENDMLHIALATIAQIDAVVSWNFKHIVHFDKIRLFNGVNIESGYKPIAIYSPREVTNYGEV